MWCAASPAGSAPDRRRFGAEGSAVTAKQPGVGGPADAVTPDYDAAPRTVEGTPLTSATPVVRCRVAACREALGDGKEWSFYLINDGDRPLDSVVLETFGHEWGDMAHTEHPDVEISDLVPGAHPRIWRDNDDEVRMWMHLEARVGRKRVDLEAEFPMLCKRLNELEMVPELGMPGWVSGVAVLKGR